MRIAICSVDHKAEETARWLINKIEDSMLLDYRANGESRLVNVINGLEIETTNPHNLCIHIGTRYDYDMICIDKSGLIMKTIRLVEKLSRENNKSLSYDKVYIVYSNSEDTKELAEDYTNLYNLPTKTLPNKPASILGKMILRDLKIKEKGANDSVG